jgi:23S rRNA pseudouridine1911/1915/1917 synthase
VADTLRFEVPEDLDGDRVDRVLASLFEVSRAQARALLDRGVLIDGSPARPSDRVHAGSVLTSPSPEAAADLQPEPVSFEVIHEDPALIVVNKPPGLVVHPGAGSGHGTLAAGLLHRYPELRGVGAPGRWGLVHRLDRDTSGVLLVARTAKAHARLSADLANRAIGRTYTALVHGAFSTQTGAIEAPIGRDPSRPTRRAVVPGGKPALTRYEVVAEYPETGLTLLDVTLETGRTHQIRVHMAAIDHPLVGDRTYSTVNTPIEVPRVFLHARRVDLQHPSTGDPVSFEADLPEDLARVLTDLEIRPDIPPLPLPSHS